MDPNAGSTIQWWRTGSVLNDLSLKGLCVTGADRWAGGVTWKIRAFVKLGHNCSQLVSHVTWHSIKARVRMGSHRPRPGGQVSYS